mmetsp:Transcript_21931/g.57725  ORF Transcript_21931/g.57725 Transcript_21931/m.57725 type:complete len:237 (-) Transcript_21931:524-1234(-)
MGVLDHLRGCFGRRRQRAGAGHRRYCDQLDGRADARAARLRFGLLVPERRRPRDPGAAENARARAVRQPGRVACERRRGGLLHHRQGALHLAAPVRRGPFPGLGRRRRCRRGQRQAPHDQPAGDRRLRRRGRGGGAAAGAPGGRRALPATRRRLLRRRRRDRRRPARLPKHDARLAHGGARGPDGAGAAAARAGLGRVHAAQRGAHVVRRHRHALRRAAAGGDPAARVPRRLPTRV